MALKMYLLRSWLDFISMGKKELPILPNSIWSISLFSFMCESFFCCFCWLFAYIMVVALLKYEI